MKSSCINPIASPISSVAPAEPGGLLTGAGVPVAPMPPTHGDAPPGHAALRRAGHRRQAASLDQLPPEVLGRIAEGFHYGGTEVSRLASTNRAMRATLGKRALADHLIASVHSRVDHQGISANLSAIIEKASDLPSDLRVEVLCRIPSRLTTYLWAPTPGFPHVFGALVDVLEHLDRPVQRYRFLHAIGAEFAAPDLRASYVQQRACDQPGMEAIYLKICAAGERIQSRDSAAICASQATETNLPAREQQHRLSSTTRAMLLRGLYMLREPTIRDVTWTALYEDVDCGVGVARQSLLEGLTDAFCDLSDEPVRRAAFSRLLAEAQKWPSEQRAAMLMRLGKQIPNFPSVDGSKDTFDAVLAATRGLHSADTPQVLASLSDCLDQAPLIMAKEIFDGILDQLPRLDPAGCAIVLAALSEQIPNLPDEPDRLEAFDAVWAAYRCIDPAAVAVHEIVANLAEALPGLPCDDWQQIRFSRLTDCVEAQPERQRDSLIDYLTSAMWSFEGRALKMSAFRDVLTLTSSRPAAAQVGLLAVLIDEINSQPFDDVQFAMLSAVERVAQRLPAPLQVRLLGEAAAAAIWLLTPYMEEQFSMLVTAAQALPQPHADAAMAGIDDAIDSATAELTRADFDDFPTYFEAIANTASVLPHASRVRTLTALIDASLAYTPEFAQQAREVILHRLQGLPNSITQPLRQRLNA